MKLTVIDKLSEYEIIPPKGYDLVFKDNKITFERIDVSEDDIFRMVDEGKNRHRWFKEEEENGNLKNYKIGFYDACMLILKGEKHGKREY